MMKTTFVLLVTAILVGVVSVFALAATTTTDLTSTCVSSGTASKVSSFATSSTNNDITLNSIDTVTILQERGCNPSRSWSYSAATQPPSTSDQQLALPNSLSTWTVDALSGVLSFTAGSSEGVSTVVEKLQCTSLSTNQVFDACTITHQILVYSENFVTSTPPSTTTSSSSGGSSSPSSTTTSSSHTNNIGACSPVYGFSVPTDDDASFTGTLQGFSGETQCPSGLATTYELVQGPSKASTTFAFSDATTGAFTYVLDKSKLTSSFDNDYFRFTKKCGGTAYCSAVAYLVLQPSPYNNDQSTTAASSPATVALCPDVYYFTTNQPLKLNSVSGGFSCGGTSNNNIQYSLFNEDTSSNNNNVISINDATTGEFSVVAQATIPTNAAGWTDFTFTAQCISSSSSCIGTAHLMILDQVTATSAASATCPAVSMRWSPTMTTPLSLSSTSSDSSSSSCLYTITSQPDFVSVALDQSTGEFHLTFADTVTNPVGWLMLSYSKSCSSSSSSSCTSGVAYIQAVPATTALPTTSASPTTTSACPTTNSIAQTQVFNWISAEATPYFQLISASGCTNYKIDYDSTRPIPPITISTASGIFTLSSSSAPEGWTNFTYSFTCGNYDAASCTGRAAVWVQPTSTSVAPSTPTTTSTSSSYPVCASTNINFLFSYLWRLGTTQTLNLMNSGNNQTGNQSLVDSTSSSVCSQFGEFTMKNSGDSDVNGDLFVLDSNTGSITLNSTFNKNIEAGWKFYSLLVSCQAPQVFTCMTRLSIMMMTPADHEITTATSTSSPNTTTTTIASTTSNTTTSNSSNGGGVIVGDSSTTTESSASSSSAPISTTSAVASSSTTPAPSSTFLATFANFQCAGTCNSESWKTVSFLPDLWDISPAGGVSLVNASGTSAIEVTNPPHLQRADGRPLDDITATYDALNAPEVLQLSATGEIGNMGVRFPTFESLSSIPSDDSSSIVDRYS